MKDYLYKGYIEELNISFAFAVTTELVNEIVLKHDCDPFSAHILGRATTAGLLGATLLKEGERLSITWKYEGIVKTILVDVGADASLRSLISPKQLMDTTEDRREIYGEKCNIRAIKSNGAKIITDSSTESILQHPVDDLDFLYSYSDQIETEISVMISLNADPGNPIGLCQGVLLQAMPDTDLVKFDEIRNRLNSVECREMMSKASDVDNYFELVIDSILGGEHPKINVEACKPPHFHCNCDADKLPQLLNMMNYNDRMDVVKKGEPLVITCHFCSSQYEFSVDELTKIWNDSVNPEV